MTFDHRDRTTPESAWSAWEPLRQLPSLHLAPTHLLVVAAHPDDETLGAGGLLAAAADAGVPADVVVATAGEASHPLSPTTDPQRLAAWRTTEVRAAVERLAPGATVHVLGLPDGGLSGRTDDLTEAVARLARPGGWVVAPWRGDGHPDHEAAGTAAAGAAQRVGARLLEYPVWAWHWAAPGDERVPWDDCVRLDLDAGLAGRKRAAMALHRSQVEPLSPQEGDEVLLAPEVLAHFERSFEVFVDGGAPAAAGPGSLGAAYFDAFYAAGGDDPWGFEDRWYERRKRALLLAALPHERYARALEVGCSIGVTTVELAARCDRLLALDAAEAPVARARERTAGLAGVRVERGAVPGDWPEGRFDLVVLSEVAYYCAGPDLDALVARAVEALAPGGVLAACHWRHAVADYPTSGDEVHERLRAHPDLAVLAEHVEEDFRLDVLVPPPAVSVARATGLLP
ncbi:PIG-L family deacetylase [Angustibacter aerolatus]